MTRKWNLQDIRPAGGRRERTRPRTQSEEKQKDIPARKARSEHTSDQTEQSVIEVLDTKKSKKKRIFVTTIAILLVLGAGFFMSFMLGGAEISISPKYKDVTVQATFSAHAAPSSGELGYELLVLEADGERQVSASGEEEVSERATGNIFVYNEYSASPQRLIKNTRFKSSDGLIFRIEESIEVPGKTTDENGAIVPGVITAKVFADGVGDQYNLPPSKFDIPGLDDTEMDGKIYGESTVDFTGGFEGTKFIINDDELETTKQSLQVELRDALLARLEGERPAGFVLYTDAITFAFDTLPATEYGDDLVTIKEKARLQVPMFQTVEFAKFLAENSVTGYEGVSVYLPDPYTLSFSYPEAVKKAEDISTLPEIEFSLAGNTRIIWEFDAEALTSDLAGLPKTALPAMLSGYPAIERAEAVVRPFWKQSFPSDSSEISVIVQTQ